ncbi:hypothetical protein AB0H73_34690, partial [Streptomyces olivoreticuli]
RPLINFGQLLGSHQHHQPSLSVRTPQLLSQNPSFDGGWGLVVGCLVCFSLGAWMCISAKRVELYAAIRRDHRAGLSMRALERKYGATWRTIRRALDSNWPEPGKKQAPRPSRLDRFKAVIDGMLEADLDAPPKWKHRVKRIFDRLLDEHAADGISYQMVRGYVAVRRREIRWEAGRGPAEVFVPRTHGPGDEADVGFGDIRIVLAGVPTCCCLFSLRLSCSGKAVRRVPASCGQEAFFEGHVHAADALDAQARSEVAGAEAGDECSGDGLVAAAALFGGEAVQAGGEAGQGFAGRRFSSRKHEAPGVMPGVSGRLCEGGR